jgi:hypothetical protein
MNMGGVPERLDQFKFIIKFIQKRNLYGHLSTPSQVWELEALAHACNPSNLGDGSWRIVVEAVLGKELARPHLN